MTVRWHALAPEALAHEFRSNLDTGLSEEEARRRLMEQGPNELPEAPAVSFFALFLAQFSSLIIWVLIVAAMVSGLLQEWVDTAAIITIVILNALLGLVQEFKAERSLAALKKLSVTTSRVVRAGVLRAISARELVPGDLIRLEAGDQVPADARLVYVTHLQTQEAALTGESTPVAKSSAELSRDPFPIAERQNMVFLGTAVTGGKGRALVVATGMQTELGRIAALIRTAAPEPTPMQRRLEQFGHLLVYLSLAVVLVVFLLGLLRGEPPVGMFLTAVSLAVAAIPEGLPAIVTITLALGVTRMVKRHALVRRLHAVETLGSATVICTDKTGTLTKNEMTVTRLWMDSHVFEITGEGYAPIGDLRQAGQPLHGQPEGLRALLTASVLCTDASLMEEQGTWRILGDPTEGALLVAAAKAQLLKEKLDREHQFLSEVPFDPERKMMTVIRCTSGVPVAYVKGAPDVLLRHCTRFMAIQGQVESLDETQRRNILKANSAFAHEALRVLGVAYRPLDQDPAGCQAPDIERDLTFLGLAAMKDPLRPEAKAAVQACRDAGVRTVMITGDHKDTAMVIAREAGILRHGTSALSGSELDTLSEEDLGRLSGNVTVYARVSAEHKLRIVQAWKSRGAVVAMTGDGVNDAPAIKAADIGIAMGLTGTDVTKQASDMVITDDNFASIAAAVEEGRAIYDNIRKAIHYLLSCNISEVLVMLIATVVGLPLPLLPVQILWINLVTDGLPALALAVDPADPDIMRRPPRQPQANLLERDRLFVMFGQGLFLALITIAAFAFTLYGMNQDLIQARTVTFTTLVLAQLFHAFNCRSDRYSLFQIGLWTNRSLVMAVVGSAALQAIIIISPWTGEVFKVASFNVEDWLVALVLGASPLLVMEAWKARQRRTDRGMRSSRIG